MTAGVTDDIRGNHRGRLELAFVLEHFDPITTRPSSASFGRALTRDHVVVNPLLHCSKVSVGRLGPEIFHDSHGVEKRLCIRLAGRKSRVFDNSLQRRITAQLPPLRLNLRLREPLDVFQRRVLAFPN